jgi:hypothetical protein
LGLNFFIHFDSGIFINELAAKEKLEIVIGLAELRFWNFAGNFPRRRRRRKSSELFSE